MLRQQLLRQADALAPEDEDRRSRIGDLLKGPPAAGGEVEWRPQQRERALELVPARPDLGTDAGPIVEPGAPDLLVLQRKPQRTDQVKLRPGSQAGPARVA